jgi:peptidoglycan/LPS O-acetylase OafA/YrhL
VGVLSRFSLRETFGQLLIHTGQWLFYMDPDLNGVRGTNNINLRVQWSLAYEWLFYCTLPVIGALFFRIRCGLITLLFSGIFIVVFLLILDVFYTDFGFVRAFPFISGIAAAFLVRSEKIKKLASNRWLTPLVISLLILPFGFFTHFFEPVPFVCASVAFVAIACGNNIFGILTTKASRLLGQISYSMYLLHTILLYAILKFVPILPKNFQVLTFWSVIAASSVVITIICCLSYRFIEKPFIDRTSKITTWLRRQFYGTGTHHAGHFF